MGLFQIRFKKLLEFIKRDFIGVVQIHMGGVGHDIQLFIFAAQSFKRVFAAHE